MPPSDSRAFLGFEAGFLPRSARVLLETHGAELGRAVVLVPGRRAGRKLLEALLDLRGGVIEPPRIVTEAGLGPALAGRGLVQASQACVEWAWFEALGEAPAEDLQPFAPPGDPELTWPLRWSLARRLAALDREWAARRGEDARSPGAGKDDRHPARLAALERISERVRARLSRVGRANPDHALRAAREGLAAPGAGAAPSPSGPLTLVGCAEISPALGALLRVLEPRPRALIQASADFAAGFDEFGAALPEFWERRPIPLEDRAWEVCANPAAAAERTLDWLAELPADTPVESVVVGVPGRDVLPGLSAALSREGLGLHSALGGGLRESSPWLALERIHEWILRHDYQALAAALRHPRIEAWLERDVAEGSAPGIPASPASTEDSAEPGLDRIGRLDAWHGEHLPDRLTGRLPGETLRRESRPENPSLPESPRESVAEALRGALERLTRELDLDAPRPLNQWTAPLGALLSRLFPELDPERGHAERRDAAALRWFADLGQDLATLSPQFLETPLRGVQALGLWLDWSADHPAPVEPTPGAVEALGWLELALEDAPHLLLFGLNEGWVPQGERSHPLPGIEADGSATDTAAVDTSRARARYARDVHALTAMALRRAGTGEQGSFLALTLRGSAAEDPLRPSRLLFHCDEPTALRRARAFFQTSVDSRRAGAREGNSAEGEAGSGGGAPLPVPHRPVLRRISVSAFKAFLNSPYLYYLEHVLRLSRVRDDSWEMDPLRYGSFAHDVLERWGRGACKDSQDPAEILSFLAAEQERLAQERFGAHPLPAVRLQLQQLRRRLECFAERQAQEARAGWRVEHVELDLEGACLEWDGVRIEIHGRVDRIDRHAQTGRRRILDYKTGNESQDPLKAHFRGGRWLDLQLPLYGHFLAPRLGSAVELGYFALPRQLSRCGVHLASFSAEQLQGALEEARRVAREILEGDFARPGRARPKDRVQRALCGLSLLALEDGENEMAPGDSPGDAGEFEGQDDGESLP
jgi:RecB family exonuclease